MDSLTLYKKIQRHQQRKLLELFEWIYKYFRAQDA